MVLFNLGGPDSPEAVKPFLYNLFNDPAIISVPWPVRPLLARLISSRRAPVAREIYAEIGGRSPLVPLTEEQAETLAAAIGESGEGEAKVFIAMRYWHPMADETARFVKAYGPDEIVLLPLYPQFSTTTTGSSVKDWKRAAQVAGLDVPTRTVCCYPLEEGWIAAQADLLRQAIRKSGEGPVRVLFSAHGLPKKVIASGDPYQWQVEQTSAAVAEAVGADMPEWVVCYQSRVGPLEWIGPSTEDEIARAGADGVGLVVVPIAFVSEHSETLVELDIEYAELAAHKGVASYVRVPAVATHSSFVAGLARVVGEVRGRAAGSVCPNGGRRICPAVHGRCPATQV
ncbi:ferrochelatase [Hyphomicrobiales bacterium FT118]|uniref:Ferrochelatase n=1 Tax=Futiania mangrovi TaxID=2959716 RepID=A0A9J6PKA0_9PROT|nr:ferrochelatase [Futiania mangrovii]